MAFLLNNTTEQFVLPAGGIVQYGTRLVCPISPWRGFVFDKNIITEEAEIGLFEIQTVNEIIDFNMESARQEQIRNKNILLLLKKKYSENYWKT